MNKVRQLKDGRWQVMREDGASLALTYEEWFVMLVRMVVAREPTDGRVE